MMLLRGRLFFMRLLRLVVESRKARTEIARWNVVDNLDGVGRRRRKILVP